MTALAAWFTRYAWVGHIPCALVLQAIVAAPLLALHVPAHVAALWAAVAVAGHFHGWKVAEAQAKLVGPGASKAPVWWREYTPLEWLMRADTRPYALQFVAPVLTVAFSTWAVLRWL